MDGSGMLLSTQLHRLWFDRTQSPLRAHAVMWDPGSDPVALSFYFINVVNGDIRASSWAPVSPIGCPQPPIPRHQLETSNSGKQREGIPSVWSRKEAEKWDSVTPPPPQVHRQGSSMSFMLK